MAGTLRRRDVVGLPAVGGGDGRPRGRVADLLYSRSGDRVTGLLLRGGAWHRRLIPYEEVAAIGPAAIVLRQSVVLSTPNQRGVRHLLTRHRQLLGRRVLRSDGTELGTIADVCFEPERGIVTGYLLSGGPVSDLLMGMVFVAADRLAQAPGLADAEGLLMLSARRQESEE